MNPHRLKAYFYLTITAIIWGVAGPVIKLTLGAIDPGTFLLYRFFLSSLATLPFILKGGLHLPRRVGILLALIICGLLNSSIGLGFLFWGTDLTSLLSMSLITVFGPLVLTIFGVIFMHDHMTKREKLGSVIAFTGAIILSIAPLLRQDHGTSQFLGNILVFLSVIAIESAGVLIKKLLREGVAATTIANVTFIVGFLSMLPIVIIQNGFSQTISTIVNLPLVYQAGVFYMALLSGNLAYTLYNLGQKPIEVSELAPFAYLYPAISAILAVVLLGDKLTVAVLVSTGIIIIGVFIAEWKKRTKPNPRKV